MSDLHKFSPTALSLLWPMALPTAIFLLMELYFLLGGVMYAHGPSTSLILLAIGWGACALIWEIVALPVFIYRLRQESPSRSRLDIFAAVAAAGYIALAIGIAIDVIGFHRA